MSITISITLWYLTGCLLAGVIISACALHWREGLSWRWRVFRYVCIGFSWLIVASALFALVDYLTYEEKENGSVAHRRALKKFCKDFGPTV